MDRDPFDRKVRICFIGFFEIKTEYKNGMPVLLQQADFFLNPMIMVKFVIYNDANIHFNIDKLWHSHAFRHLRLQT